MSKETLPLILAANGYRYVRELPNGEIAGIARMAFTYGLFVGLNETSYRTRFCYEKEGDAVAALTDWDGEGFPPGYWIKQKPQEIIGPGGKGKFPVNTP